MPVTINNPIEPCENSYNDFINTLITTNCIDCTDKNKESLFENFDLYGIEIPDHNFFIKYDIKFTDRFNVNIHGNNYPVVTRTNGYHTSDTYATDKNTYQYSLAESLKQFAVVKSIRLTRRVAPNYSYFNNVTFAISGILREDLIVSELTEEVYQSFLNNKYKCRDNIAIPSYEFFKAHNVKLCPYYKFTVDNQVVTSSVEYHEYSLSDISKTEEAIKKYDVITGIKQHTVLSSSFVPTVSLCIEGILKG